MGKTAFIFPGQGSQYVGMGKDFYENYPEAQEIFDIAEQASGLPVKEICFTENEKINITEYTQIAMLATEIALWKVLDAKGIKADITAGLSLGEYAALAAAHVLEPKDLFRIIKCRGKYMQDAYPVGGAMTAILGLDGDTICRVCEETEGIDSVANFNCPGQIVISGEQGAVNAAAEKLAAAGAKRCVPLKVSGPFHSQLMQKAGQQLADELAKADFKAPQIPYISNVEATLVTESAPVADLLIRQVSGSVCWQQTIEQMIAMGVTTFVEIGPGKSLTGFVKKISRDVTCINIDKLEDLEKLA